MGSPPVQTPVLFLKGGGAAIFSAACVEALLKAGYDPEWFGSHSHVRKKIAGAQARVAAHQEWESGGKKGPEPELKPNDPYLARCQAGHISQDATHRQSGGRDNACANLQYGYDTNTAPCMPQTAGPWDPPGSEHNVASRHEVACALRDGPNGPYDPAQREKDEQERLRLVVDKRRPSDREPITPAAAAPASGAAAAAGDPAAAAGAGAGDPSQPSVPDGEKIQGKDAADCINNFKKSAMQAMRSQVTDERVQDQKDNREAANGRAQKPGESDADYKKAGDDHRQGLNNQAEAAQKQADAVSAERARLAQQGGGHTTAAQTGRAAADKAPDDAAAQQAARERGERAQETKGSVNAAKSAETFAQDEASRTARIAGRADRANCEANEGAQLAAMSPAQRAAASENGTNRGPETARTSGVSPQTRDQFGQTQANDPMGAISA